MTKYKNIILVLTVSCAKNPIKPNCQNVNWIANCYCIISISNMWPGYPRWVADPYGPSKAAHSYPCGLSHFRPDAMNVQNKHFVR